MKNSLDFLHKLWPGQSSMKIGKSVQKTTENYSANFSKNIWLTKSPNFIVEAKANLGQIFDAPKVST